MYMIAGIIFARLSAIIPRSRRWSTFNKVIGLYDLQSVESFPFLCIAVINDLVHASAQNPCYNALSREGIKGCLNSISSIVTGWVISLFWSSVTWGRSRYYTKYLYNKYILRSQSFVQTKDVDNTLQIIISCLPVAVLPWAFFLNLFYSYQY